MTTDQVTSSLSQLSLHPNGSSSETEDWDRTLNVQPASGQRISLNSVAFPTGAEQQEDIAKAQQPDAVVKGGQAEMKRTLSELLRLHAEKGTNVTFSAEEASRVAEVLGQWVSRISRRHFQYQGGLSYYRCLGHAEQKSPSFPCGVSRS